MQSNKDYLKYIKSKNCLVCGVSPVDPDHLEHLGMGGANKGGLKDYSCVPLCRMHHRFRHDGGTEKFERRYKINLWKEAFYLLREYFAK